MSIVTIVGGGLGGLIAGIEVSERGGSAVLLERSSHLGGRARTTGSEYRINYGPHAVYADGSVWRWLKARRLLPPTRRSNPLTVRFAHQGRSLRGLPAPVRRSMLLSLRSAPPAVSFREWISDRVPADEIDSVCRVSCFYSFAHDPGLLSAQFVNERNARLVRPPSPARFVSDGGWQRIVNDLERHARAVGVDIVLNHPVDELPDGPVIVATEKSAASKLLGEPLEAPSVDAVLLDVAMTGLAGEPTAVMDLDGGAFIERYTAFDPHLAPAGQELLQCHIGRRPGEGTDAAVVRIEAALEVAFPGWRQRETWRAVRRSEGRTGAVELPGQPWTCRPKVVRGEDRYLVGDFVAAPGLLSEVSVTSAVEAAAAAVTRSQNTATAR